MYSRKEKILKIVFISQPIMSSCDMCGKETALVTAEVENVDLKVCQNCARFGVVRQKADVPHFQPQKMHKDPALRVTANYASIVRQIREKRGLSQEDFAKFLQERESIVAKWEQGRMQPSVEMARRLEKILGVSLIVEDVEQAFEKENKNRADGFTLGDFVKVRKKI